MNQRNPILRHIWFVLVITASFAACANIPIVSIKNEENKSTAIPMDQLGAVAGKQYQGDGLSVCAMPDGARLRCAFQRLEGQVTREGLWLSSTTDGSSDKRFRVRAMAVGRADDFGFKDLSRSVAVPGHSDVKIADVLEPSAPLMLSTLLRPGTGALRETGTVNVADNVARFIRPGLTEEYTVSVDGVRQDFIIEQRPAGKGELRVELNVTGAKTKPLVNGVQLVMDGSGRKLAYNRLRVTDATGRELSARMEVISERGNLGKAGKLVPANGAHGTICPTLAVLVEDAAAIYPVRIDPTFSDANWMSMNASIPGANGSILALVVDSSGMLYLGGGFTVVGGIKASGIAKWDGANWTALGSGVNGSVTALAVLDGNLYAGGSFTTAGGIAASRIARWNGSNWSALGAGVGGVVFPSVPVVNAIAVSGSDVYVGGQFTTAGGGAAQSVAKWNGSNWAALGSGVGGVTFPNSPSVFTLAVSGSELYVGGFFTTAGSWPCPDLVDSGCKHEAWVFLVEVGFKVHR